MTSPRNTLAVPSPEQMELLRKAPVSQRLELAMALSEAAAEQARRSLRRIHPEIGDRELRLKLAELHYGRELADRIRRELALERGDGSVPPDARPWSQDGSEP